MLPVTLRGLMVEVIKMSNLIYYGNAIVCFVCAYRIASYNRGKSEFKRCYGLLAIVLATSFFSVTVRTLLGVYNHGSVDISEFAINIFYCVGLVVAGGNVAKLVRSDKSAAPPTNNTDDNPTLKLFRRFFKSKRVSKTS